MDRQQHIIPCLISDPLRRRPLATVSTVVNCFSFLSDGLHRLVGRDPHTMADVTETSQHRHRTKTTPEAQPVTPAEVVNRLSDRYLSSSGCFYGVGATEVGHGMITAAAQNFLETYAPDKPLLRPIQFTLDWAIEKNLTCRQEALANPNGPKHLFKDIDDFIPAEHRRSCGLDGGNKKSNDVLRQTLPYINMRRRAWCFRCKHICQIAPTHIHQASAPCVYHSSLGNQDRNDGDGMRYHWLWIALMRTLRIAVIWTENVKQFGDVDFEEFLGDIYYVTRTITNPLKFGFPHRRERQIVLLILKAILNPMLTAGGIECTPVAVFEMLNLEESVQVLFERTRAESFTWRSFLGAAADNMELARERRWASSRGTVVARHANPADDTYSDDTPGSILACLRPAERQEYEAYQRTWLGEACDVGQSAVACPQHSSNGVLHLLTKHVGLVVVPPESGRGPPERWLTPSELFGYMGFPVAPDMVRGAKGASCIFSLDRQPPACRTPHSQRCQVGNTLHITALPPLELVLYIKLPQIGERLSPLSAAGPSSSLSSSAVAGNSANAVIATNPLPMHVATSPASSFGSSLQRVRDLKRQRS
jgi:site-specific DNA-cytosine methylase